MNYLGAMFCSLFLPTSVGGDVFRAVAAYNAGPEAVANWAPGSDDADIFVEAIDFRETREYVKLIYEYQSIYRGVLAASGAGASRGS